MESNALISEFYKNQFLCIKRGVMRGGHLINAKPIFLLALIHAIQIVMLKENKITLEDIEPMYKMLYKRYEPSTEPTPICKPFYHLSNDGFWHLKWKQGPVKVTTVHAKFIRDNIEYAYLDNALWDLLQDEQIRQDYRNTIENFFLK